MTSNVSSSITPRLDLRLAAYAAAGVALAAPAVSSTARADIIYSGPLTIAVPQTSPGIYFNFLTGATGITAASVPGYDFNPYLGTGFSFFWSGTAGTPGTGNAGLVNTSAIYQVLAPGALISSTGTYAVGGGASFMANYRAGEIAGYLGMHFTNETTGAVNYAWVQLSTSAGSGTTTGFPATILGYAYNNTGGSILAGQITNVPEPTTNAALGLGALALGAVGIRRMRQSKQAVA